MDKNLSNKQLWDKIYQDYKDICKECHRQIGNNKIISSLQPIPYIGSKFYSKENNHRIMFVGKGTYGNEKYGGYDVFTTDNVKDLFFKNYYSFWNWVKEISKSILGTNTYEEAFPYFTYTNVHKCQVWSKNSDSDEPDFKTPPIFSINCIQKAGWIYREINEVKPTNVVLFLGYANDCFLYKLFIQNEKDIDDFDYSSFGLNCGLFKKGHIIQLRDGKRRFILTNHPQGTPVKVREDIVRIIKENDWSNSLTWKMPVPS